MASTTKRVKSFPATLKTSDGRIWTRAADYCEGPGITVNYARYLDGAGRAAYSCGGRCLYAITYVVGEDSWVCQPGRKLADVIA